MESQQSEILNLFETPKGMEILNLYVGLMNENYKPGQRIPFADLMYFSKHFAESIPWDLLELIVSYLKIKSQEVLAFEYLLEANSFLYNDKRQVSLECIITLRQAFPDLSSWYNNILDSLISSAFQYAINKGYGFNEFKYDLQLLKKSLNIKT
jgi:hypothetical protein